MLRNIVSTHTIRVLNSQKYIKDLAFAQEKILKKNGKASNKRRFATSGQYLR